MYNRHCVFKKWSWDHLPIFGSRGWLTKKKICCHLQLLSDTENVEQSAEESIVELKQRKAKAKSAFTRVRHHLLVHIQGGRGGCGQY